MKRIIILLLSMFLLVTAFAQQLPRSFKYQAVVRDQDGKLIANKVISIKISIIREQEGGPVIYSEEYENYATNDYGIVSVNVGTGNAGFGNFDNIQWAQYMYFLRVEIDLTATKNNYVLMGTSQILSVPYALYARDVLNKNDADADPLNEIQDLELVNHTLKITGNDKATPIQLSQYLGIDTDQQNLSLTNQNGTVQISIERGNSVSFNMPSDFVSKTTGGVFGGPINATNFLGTGILNLQGNFTLSGTSPVLFNSLGNTNLTLPTTGTLATQDWVSQNINTSNSLATGNIWVGVGNIQTALPANGAGHILIGNGTGIGSFPISGDASLSSSGILSLSGTGITSGFYFLTQVDSKGRVISGSNPSTLAGFGITDALSTNLSSGNIYIGNSSNIASQFSISGDASLSNSGVLTLTNTSIVPGTYQSVTVDSKGRVTNGTNPTTLAGFGIVDGMSRNLTDGFILIGNASNMATAVILQGDATLSNTGQFNLTNSGISPGTYRSITIDAKGRAIAGSNPTTLAGYGIMDAMNTSHPANAISNSTINNWNTAFSWGNHASNLYRPISYVPTWAEIQGKPSTLSGFGISDGISNSLPAGNILVGSSSNIALPVSLKGDATLSSDGTLTLSNTTVVSGIYRSVSVDSKGRVTAGTNPTTLAGYGITDALSTTHPSSSITLSNIENWNTAFGWGNHASNLYRPITYVPAWSEITSNPFSFASPANNQMIRYNSSTGRWENWTPNFISTWNETDPVYIASAASGITSTNIANWNTAFSWTDHAGKYRPISYVPAWSEITSNPFSFSSPANNQLVRYNSSTGRWENFTPNFITTWNETDPVYIASVASGITSENISNWNTAFSWTDHAGKYRPVTYVPTWAEMTDKPTTLSGFGITDGQTRTLTSGRIWVGNLSNEAQSVALSGDATLDAVGTLNLITTGVSAGTYRSVTVDTKGRITAGSNPTTLVQYGVVLSEANFFVGNAQNEPVSVSMSGDATLNNTGQITVSKIGGHSVSLGGSFSSTNGNISFQADASGSSLVLPASGTLLNQANLDNFSGTSNITTLGTIATGTWQGTTISSSKIDWSEPGVIGGTTPNTGAFTRVKLSVLTSDPTETEGAYLYVKEDGSLYLIIDGTIRKILFE
jgi:phage-related tail fiber protein